MLIACLLRFSHSFISFNFLRYFFLLVFLPTLNLPRLLLLQKWVKPRKSNVAGVFPCLLALCSSNIPKPIKRVFSSERLSPNFFSLSRSASNTFFPSGSKSTQTTKSSQYLISSTYPLHSCFSFLSNHRSRT